MIEKKNASLSRVLIYVLLVIWAVIVLFPFYWMVLTSVKSFASYNSEYIPRSRRCRTMQTHLRRCRSAAIS